jgi:hypothetical protein
MPWPALTLSGLQRFESATTFPVGSPLRGEPGSRRLVARGEIGVEELVDGLQFGSFGGRLHALGLLAAQLTDLDSFAVTGPTAPLAPRDMVVPEIKSLKKTPFRHL